MKALHMPRKITIHSASILSPLYISVFVSFFIFFLSPLVDPTKVSEERKWTAFKSSHCRGSTFPNISVIDIWNWTAWTFVFFCLAFSGRGKQREPFLCFLDMYESLRSTVWISFFSMFYNWSNCTVFLHSFYPWNIVIDRKTALKINHCVESFWFPRYSHWIALFRLRKWGFQYSVELSKSREYFTTAPTSTILRAN